MRPDHPGEVVDTALAHVVKNNIEAAYRRTHLYSGGDATWADYLKADR